MPTAVIIATDDERILREAEGFGARAVMTAATHRTGTDRLAEVAAQFPEFEIIVNVQGDEPCIESSLIDRLASALAAHPDWAMATVSAPLAEADFANPNAVKVVCNLAGEALYFSRSLLPYPREKGVVLPRKHLGMYAYRRDFLCTFAALPSTPLEQAESLEQLRALEHGYRIGVIETEKESIGIDTPADVERVRAYFEGGTADENDTSR